MNRAALAVAAACIAALPPAHAQVQRFFPADALRGELAFGTPPQALLNGRPVRLAPAARIRGQDNAMVMSGALAGRKAVVHYTVDTYGLLKDVWILQPRELANKPWPATPQQAGAWVFDPVGQTWHRP